MLVLFGLFLALLVLNAPIGMALGVASLISLWVLKLPTDMLATMMFAGMAKFGLLAIPLFILAGMILERCGISERLVRLASALIGPVHGSLALVTVAVGIIFAGISGSGPADVAALGTILIPAMVARGYRPDFAAALMASAGSIAIVIPPSIAFIIYGVLAEVSITSLFLAGILPGVLMGGAMAVYCWLTGRRQGLRGERRGPPGQVWAAFKDAFWGLLAPLVILVGLYGGVFTPTEAAGVVVIYGLAVGVFVYRALRLRDLYRLAVDAAVASAVVMLIVACAGLFAWIVTVQGVAAAATAGLVALAQSPWLFLLVVNALLLVAGCFLDAISIYYLAVPILMPAVRQLGVDPVHFGVIMTVNLAIGQFTPPVGVNLYVASGVAGIPLGQIFRSMAPFILFASLSLLVITYVPWFSTWLPSLVR